MSKTQHHHAKEISDALERATYWSMVLEATPNAVRVDVCLTDRHRRIVFMNRAAEHLVSRSNALRVRNNHLVPTDCTARRALAAAMDEAIDKHVINGLTIALPASDNAGLLATIFPLRF